MCAQPSAARPDERGRFGPYGGQYIPETLMAAVAELEDEYRAARAGPAFEEGLADIRRHQPGRPKPLHVVNRHMHPPPGATSRPQRETPRPTRPPPPEPLPRRAFTDVSRSTDVRKRAHGRIPNRSAG